jgi:hypothetical protein
MVCYVAKCVVKVNQSFGGSVAIQSTVEGEVGGEGPVASKAKGSTHLSIANAHKRQRVSEAKTDSEGEDRGRPVRQSEPQGVGLREGAVTGMCKLAREVDGAAKVHSKVAHHAQLTGEITPTDKVEATDKLKVVDDAMGARTDAGEVAGEATGPVTSAGVGEVAGEVAGEVEVTSEVASAIEVECQFLHAMTKAGEVKYGAGSHHQPCTQIP